MAIELKDDIRDIFEISSTKGIDESFDDRDAIADIDFAARSDEVSGVVKKVSDKATTLEITEKKEMAKEESKSSEDLLKSSIEQGEGQEKEAYGDDIFGEFDPDAETGKKDEKVEENDEKSNRKEEENVDSDVMENDAKTAEKQEEIISSQVKNDVKIEDGEIQWLFKPPSDKYKFFYEEKKSILATIMPDGQITYNAWMKELQNSAVDISTLELYDLKEIHAKTVEVQKVRDRVQEIALQCNAQYFLWERSLELFRGLLSRIEPNLKPASAREGLIYEHMRDMELYFTRLRSIHRSSDHVLKTLELAFETLSRQVTIALQNREPVERYSKHDVKQQKQRLEEITQVKEEMVKQQFADYDKLEDGAESKPPPKKTGVVEWDE
tara:strand:- start:9495 stop:10640 length:1146 start_codon:yes stop_codon:yes gene_type:complete